MHGTKGTESDEDDVAVRRLPIHENSIERMYTNEQRTRTNEKLFVAPRGDSIRNALENKKIETKRIITAGAITTLD